MYQTPTKPPSETPSIMRYGFKPGSAQDELAGQLAARQLCKEQLGDQITELAAHIHAATFRLLELIREFDACEGWAGEGVLSCAHWLNWKCGMALGVARERIRVAHALEGLPKISQTFRKGKISYSKVRAITRVATRKNENYLLMISHYGTASHVERLVRNYRLVKRHEALQNAQEQDLQRELSWFVDDDGYWVIRGRLSPESGSLVQQVLEQIMEEQYQELPGATQPRGRYSKLTLIPAFTLLPKRLRASGWASKWMMISPFWECCSWNRGQSAHLIWGIRTTVIYKSYVVLDTGTIPTSSDFF